MFSKITRQAFNKVCTYLCQNNIFILLLFADMQHDDDDDDDDDEEK